MLNGLVHSWALAGVVGVGLTAAVTHWYLARLASEKVDTSLMWSWLLVAGAPILGAQIGPEGPLGGSGVLLVTGLVLLGRVIAEPTGGERSGRPIVVVIVGVVLGAAAALLPGVAWRGFYGLALLVSVVWLASRSRNVALRPIFGLGVVLLALAALGLVVGWAQPAIGPAVDGSVIVLIFGGLVALATASVVGRVAADVGSLQRKLGDLEDDHEHLLRISEADPLTGCPTRQALRAWFERWDGGQPVSVVLIDVDNLKRINDRHGHEAGDEALRLVANVLKGSIRPGDLVVRWGGDEFVVVLRGADHEAAKRRFTGLISSLQESAGNFPHDESLRVDWGVASCTSPDDISRALAEADERMFAMKRRR